MAEDSGCLGMAILIMVILLIGIFVLHLLVIYPYLVKLAKIRIERYQNYTEYNTEYNTLLNNKLDNTPQGLVDNMNKRFEFTPEKIDANPELFKKMLEDPYWSKFKFIKHFKNTQ